jgi:hypothetical protein
MTISSRTPEGSPWRCPMCGSYVRMEPSWPSGDATCSHCGTLLWPQMRPSRLRVHAYRWLLKVLAFGLLACLCLVMLSPIVVLLGLMVLPAKKVLGLGIPEISLLLMLGVLLFGRKLPDIARYLGHLSVRLQRSGGSRYQ